MTSANSLFYCSVFFLWALLPTAAHAQSAKNTDLRILTYNTHHANPPARPGEIDLAAIGRVITETDPDLVALQEIDVHTERSGKAMDQADSLARLTNRSAYFFKTIDFEGGAYGIAILSKYPIEAKEGRLMPSASSTEEQRAVAFITVTPPNGRPFIFASTHFGLSAKTRVLQSAFIRQTFEQLGKPVILCGDFNSVAGSEEIMDLDGFFTRSGKDSGSLTIPADKPSKEIDFIMYAPKGPFRVLEHRAIQEKLASDHLPVLAVIRYSGK